MEAIDILYLTLAVCAAVLTIFVSVTLIYMMFILRDVTRVTDDVRVIVDKVNTYITKPLLMTKSIIDFVGPFIQNAEQVVKKVKKGR